MALALVALMLAAAPAIAAARGLTGPQAAALCTAEALASSNSDGRLRGCQHLIAEAQEIAQELAGLASMGGCAALDEFQGSSHGEDDAAVHVFVSRASASEAAACAQAPLGWQPQALPHPPQGWRMLGCGVAAVAPPEPTVPGCTVVVCRTATGQQPPEERELPTVAGAVTAASRRKLREEAGEEEADEHSEEDVEESTVTSPEVTLDNPGVVISTPGAGGASDVGTEDGTVDLSQFTCGYTLPEGEATIIDDPSLPDWMQGMTVAEVHYDCDPNYRRRKLMTQDEALDEDVEESTAADPPTTTPEVNVDSSGSGVSIASPGARPGAQPGAGVGVGAVGPDDNVVDAGSANGTAGAAEGVDDAAGGGGTVDLSQFTCGYTLPEGEATIIDDPSLPDWMQGMTVAEVHYDCDPNYRRRRRMSHRRLL